MPLARAKSHTSLAQTSRPDLFQEPANADYLPSDDSVTRSTSQNLIKQALTSVVPPDFARTSKSFLPLQNQLTQQCVTNAVPGSRVITPQIRTGDGVTKYIYMPSNWNPNKTDDDIIDLPSNEPFILTSNNEYVHASNYGQEKKKVADIYAPPQPKPSLPSSSSLPSLSAFESFLLEREMHLKDPYCTDSSYARLPPARNPRSMFSILRQNTSGTPRSQSVALPSVRMPNIRSSVIDRTSQQSLLSAAAEANITSNTSQVIMSDKPLFRVLSRETTNSSANSPVLQQSSLSNQRGLQVMGSGSTQRVIAAPGNGRIVVASPQLAKGWPTNRDIVKSATVAAGLNTVPLTPRMMMVRKIYLYAIMP